MIVCNNEWYGQFFIVIVRTAFVSVYLMSKYLYYTFFCMFVVLKYGHLKILAESDMLIQALKSVLDL